MVVEFAGNGAYIIHGIEEFYDSGGAAVILVASNGTIKVKNGLVWDAIDVSIGQNWSTSRDVKIDQWGVLDSIYFANGNDRAFRRNSDGSVTEAGRSSITIVDYSIIDNGDEVAVTVDGSITIIIAGGTDWTASVDNETTAASLASALNGVSGLTVTSSGAIITIICDMTVHLQSVSTSMEAVGGIVETAAFLGRTRAT